MNLQHIINELRQHQVSCLNAAATYGEAADRLEQSLRTAHPAIVQMAHGQAPPVGKLPALVREVEQLQPTALVRVETSSQPVERDEVTGLPIIPRATAIVTKVCPQCGPKEVASTKKKCACKRLYEGEKSAPYANRKAA